MVSITISRTDGRQQYRDQSRPQPVGSALRSKTRPFFNGAHLSPSRCGFGATGSSSLLPSYKVVHLSTSDFDIMDKALQSYARYTPETEPEMELDAVFPFVFRHQKAAHVASHVRVQTCLAHVYSPFYENGTNRKVRSCCSPHDAIPYRQLCRWCTTMTPTATTSDDEKELTPHLAPPVNGTR